MNRSRTRVSRGLIAVLVLAVAVATVSILHKSNASRANAKGPAQPSAGGPAAALPVSVVRVDPAARTLAQDPPPIQTTTPTSAGSQPLDSSAPRPAAPPSITAVAALEPARTSSTAGRGAAWNQLLQSGSADGSVPAVPPTAPRPAITTGNGPLADGQARVAAGQLLDARAVLNDALQAGRLSDADAASAKAMLGDVNQTVVFSPRIFPDDPYGGGYAVKAGDSLKKIAAAYNTTWELLGRINNLDPRKLRAGSTIKVVRGPFFASVDKKAFTMDVYLGALPGEKGSMYVRTFRVGLGRDDSTPTGTWAIAPKSKLKHPKYYPPQGGRPIEADDPANPLGGYWIALTGVDGQALGKRSYGIHGTIDPDSIGHQSSMGCIRLKNEDITLVFELMVEGQSMVTVKE